MPDPRLRPLFLTLAAAVMLAFGSAAPPLMAQPVPKSDAGRGPAWSELTPGQRSALAPLQQDWAQIDTQRRTMWLDIASRFPTLPIEEQRRMQGRMAEWARLSPAERGRARASFQETKQLPREDRQARWEAYQALSPEQRQALVARKPAPVERQAPAGDAKRNIVGNPVFAAPAGKPVAPMLMQAKPGATTTLVTQQPKPPVHQQPGMPKVAASPGFVDSKTLLPRRGAQGAATPPAQGTSAPRRQP